MPTTVERPTGCEYWAALGSVKRTRPTPSVVPVTLASTRLAPAIVIVACGVIVESVPVILRLTAAPSARVTAGIAEAGAAPIAAAVAYDTALAIGSVRNRSPAVLNAACCGKL